jgi:hypothetical protein
VLVVTQFGRDVVGMDVIHDSTLSDVAVVDVSADANDRRVTDVVGVVNKDTSLIEDLNSDDDIVVDEIWRGKEVDEV